VEKLFKGEKMKTKLILTAVALLIFQAKDVFAVENASGDVDNKYQHELICQALTEAQVNYEFSFKWSLKPAETNDGTIVRSAFAYDLKNLSDSSEFSGAFGDAFFDHAKISETNELMQATGNYFLNKRLGYSEHNVDILFDKKPDGSLSLGDFTDTRIESFHNSICGRRDCIAPDVPEEEVVTSISFVSSTCQVMK
jgi:hypothetical protein